MELNLTLDPFNTDDIHKARAVLDLIEGTSASTQNAPSLTDAVLAAGDPNNPKFGWRRLGFLKAVADAGDNGLDIEQFKADHFHGDSASYGGTHSSIERSWDGSGGPAYSKELIAKVNTSDGARHVMFSDARPLIQAMLDEVTPETHPNKK